MNLKKILLTSAAPIVALGLSVALLTPGTTEGYSLIGGSLSQSQRDFRTYNNFSKPQTNNNTTPNSNFPGYTGAVMAIWKAAVEWGSELHGTGNGDPHQNGGLGSGGANFDASFQGEATQVGGTNGNIHSQIAGSSGGVLAFTETPISNGWRIRYYEGWNWADGPGSSVSGIDLQGVACHEYGHALGLGHSSVSGATMFPSISGTGVGQRSLKGDDSNGVQAIYGSKAANKPHISSVSVSSGVITITGTNFDSNGNQIWFTQKAKGGTGTPIKVTGLSSNGTTVTANVPATAGPGDVLVRRNSTTHSGLSNAYPTDLGGGGGPPGGGAPVISTVSPASIDAVIVDGPLTITLNGSGFTGTTTVTIDGTTLPSFPAGFAVISDSVLTFSMPIASQLGPVAIDITNPSGTGSSTINIVANANATVELANSAPSFLFQALGLNITVGGAPGDIAFILASPDLLPTPLPGLVDVDLAIGNNYTSLFILGSPVIGAAGYTKVNIPMSGLPTGFTLHVQSAHLFLSTLYALPAQASNVQTGTILFSAQPSPEHSRWPSPHPKGGGRLLYPTRPSLPILSMRTLALAGGLVAAALFAPRIEPALATQPRIEANAGCKPSAPIQLELLSSRVTRGVLEVDYLVRPTIEGRDVYVHINGEAGSEVLRHSAADTSGIQRGEARYGSARVRLPHDFELHGTLVELHAGLTFDGSGDDGTHAVETQEFVRTLLLGGPREASGVELVTSGDETTLDTPATRTEGR